MDKIIKMNQIINICAVLLCFAVCCLGGPELGRGWNDNIDWVTRDKGVELSKSTNKPLMVVIHKSWCGACKALKPRFAGSEEIQKLSESFVMVNTLDDEEPSDKKYSPDGGYIPRILFFNPSGSMLSIINERGSEQYKYYYHSPDDIVESMKRVLSSGSTSDPDASHDEL